LETLGSILPEILASVMDSVRISYMYKIRDAKYSEFVLFCW